MTHPTDYQHCRDAIRSGDLLAWSHTGWKTWTDWKIQAVRFFTQSEYAHVGLAMVFGGRVWVLEAVKPVVRIVPLSNLLPAYWVHLPVKWTWNAEEYAFSLVGKAKYSEWEAIKAYFGRNVNGEAWQCAELVHAVLQQCGLHLPCLDTPAEMVKAAQKLGGVVLLEES